MKQPCQEGVTTGANADESAFRTRVNLPFNAANQVLILEAGIVNWAFAGFELLDLLRAICNSLKFKTESMKPDE